MTNTNTKKGENNMIGFIIGLVAGAPIGFVVSALCTANSRFEEGDDYQ